jgi:hypothetical protein
MRLITTRRGAMLLNVSPSQVHWLSAKKRALNLHVARAGQLAMTRDSALRLSKMLFNS